jgi:hypothetical protein
MLCNTQFADVSTQNLAVGAMLPKPQQHTHSAATCGGKKYCFIALAISAVFLHSRSNPLLDLVMCYAPQAVKPEQLTQQLQSHEVHSMSSST